MDKGNFDIFEAINEIFRHIKQSSNQLNKQSTRKKMIDKISMRLLGLEIKSDDPLKAKSIKYIVKMILPDYEESPLISLKQHHNK